MVRGALADARPAHPETLMINGLKVLFGAILVVMLYVTVTATLDRGVFEAGSALWLEPWFRATLADAYCGFLAFYAWVFYRERSRVPRGLWFVAIMALGNIAVAVYVLILLFRLPPGAGPEQLLLRPRA
jgi:hypothetical protein